MDRAVHELAPLGPVAGVVADICQYPAIERMVSAVVEKFGHLDILVNNAGGSLHTPSKFEAIDESSWDKVVDVNLKGTFLCCQAAVKQFRKQGGGGKIINVTTSGFFFGNPNYVHYVASKAGVIGLTRSMARELGEYKINVNCIAPGATLADDPGDKAVWEQRRKRLTELVVPKLCFKRVQYPEDLVGTAIFLASSDSDFITGQTIVVDGGDVMH